MHASSTSSPPPYFSSLPTPKARRLDQLTVFTQPGFSTNARNPVSLPVTELLKPKRTSLPSKPAGKPHPFSPFRNRDGLGAYTADPTTFPPNRVIYHNADFVAINDLYPKASIHTLLLSRSPAHSLQHPFDAFEDAAFLASVQRETRKLKTLAAKELRRRYAHLSAKEKQREKALSERREAEASGEGKGDAKGDGDGKEVAIPPGRDWEAEIIVGVHAHPSMNHLHVHVLSRDMHSPCLKGRKHYNSFTTPFLVDVADFPLAADDPRRHGQFLTRNLKCWRCGRDFGVGFKSLKDHLNEEFEQWRKE